MSQDSNQDDRDTEWTQLAEMIETAARARRLFPPGGFKGVDSGALQVLIAIAVWPGLSAGEIAKSIAFEKSSVSRPLADLEALGLVVSNDDAEDGRRRILAVTVLGEELVADFLEQARTQIDTDFPDDS